MKLHLCLHTAKGKRAPLLLFAMLIISLLTFLRLNFAAADSKAPYDWGVTQGNILIWENQSMVNGTPTISYEKWVINSTSNASLGGPVTAQIVWANVSEWNSTESAWDNVSISGVYLANEPQPVVAANLTWQNLPDWGGGEYASAFWANDTGGDPVRSLFLQPFMDGNSINMSWVNASFVAWYNKIIAPWNPSNWLTTIISNTTLTVTNTTNNLVQYRLQYTSLGVLKEYTHMLWNNSIDFQYLLQVGPGYQPPSSPNLEWGVAPGDIITWQVGPDPIQPAFTGLMQWNITSIRADTVYPWENIYASVSDYNTTSYQWDPLSVSYQDPPEVPQFVVSANVTWQSILGLYWGYPYAFGVGGPYNNLIVPLQQDHAVNMTWIRDSFKIWSQFGGEFEGYVDQPGGLTSNIVGNSLTYTNATSGLEQMKVVYMPSGVLEEFWQKDWTGTTLINYTLVNGTNLSPLVTVTSPLPFQVFNATTPAFQLSVIDPGETVTNIWYSFNGGATNYSISAYNGNLDAGGWGALPNGTVGVTFFANNTNHHQSNTTIYIGKDILPPVITIRAPIASPYSTPPAYSITVVEGDLAYMWYTLNGGTPFFFQNTTGTINAALWGALADGLVTIRFYANDTVGNLASQSVNVTKSTAAVTPPPLLPWWMWVIIGVAAGMCVIGVVLLVKARRPKVYRYDDEVDAARTPSKPAGKSVGGTYKKKSAKSRKKARKKARESQEAQARLEGQAEVLEVPATDLPAGL